MAELVARPWQGRREEGSFVMPDGGNSSGPLSFLGYCWVSPPRSSVTAQPALQRRKVLAEITCHGNKILVLSKLVFGKDPNGITDFTNQIEDIPLAVRSLFPRGMKWLSKKMMLRAGAKQKWTLRSCGLFSYIVHILCISLPDWYFLVYTIYSVYVITSQTFSEIQMQRVLVSQ